MTDVSVLYVQLYGVPIGTLTRLDGDRTLFAFNEDHIADGGRPVLGLAFKDRFGELITEFRLTQTSVLPFFSNLLPEGRLRTYLAARAGVKPAREFFLLWALGSDMPGAVTIVPAEGEAWPARIDDRGERNPDRSAKPLRFSLAGVQLKFSAVQAARGGLSIPASGVGGSWIVKLPSREFPDIPQNEYAMMTLARQIGMDVPTTHLVDVDKIANLPEEVGTLNGKALAIERFDRLADGTPVHIEDFAQVFNVYPDDKYRAGNMRGIANVIATESNEEDIAEFIRRLTFNALIGNADMHLKNWSLIYPDRRRAKLAPAYDFLSTIPYIPDDEMALNVSRTRRFDEFSDDELSHLAAKAALPERIVLETARETVELFHQYWVASKAHLPLADDVIAAVEDHLRTVPIAR